MVDRDPLACLIGKVVTDATTVQDYIQLAIGPETGLSIYNEFELTPAGPLLDLVGQTVVAVTSTPMEVVIRFARARMTVDLRDAAFSGPEAMQLNRIGHPVVIWN